MVYIKSHFIYNKYIVYSSKFTCIYYLILYNPFNKENQYNKYLYETTASFYKIYTFYTKNFRILLLWKYKINLILLYY